MSTKCRECGASITWKLEGKKKQAFDPDGKVHWDLCSKLKWQQVKATGERFETEYAVGYANSIHGTKYEMIRAKKVSMPRKKIVSCGRDSGACEQPPWEVCASQCPNAL